MADVHVVPGMKRQVQLERQMQMHRAGQEGKQAQREPYNEAEQIEIRPRHTAPRAQPLRELEFGRPKISVRWRRMPAALPFGALRVKCGGGDNGHHGLKSLRRSLGTGDYYRVRVGIGRPPGRQDPADWVLREFSGPERKEIDLIIERAADAVESLVADGLPATQNLYND